jgi:hypothetical protein
MVKNDKTQNDLINENQRKRNEELFIVSGPIIDEDGENSRKYSEFSNDVLNIDREPDFALKLGLFQ